MPWSLRDGEMVEIAMGEIDPSGLLPIIVDDNRHAI